MIIFLVLYVTSLYLINLYLVLGIPWSSSLILLLLPPLSPPVTTSLFPVSLFQFCYIRLFYFFVSENIQCLSLSDFTKHYTLQVHPCCFRWNNFILFMAELYFILCVCVHTHAYHIFIHASLDGHLDFYNILAIVNKTAENIGVHISFFFWCL